MTKELIVIEKKPKIPTTWDYKESVSKVKQVIYKWKNLTVDLASELYIAREVLSNPGSRTDLKENQTWSNYCKEIGTERMTIHRWLNNYFPNLVTNVTKLEKPIPPKGEYENIVIDPPWPYGTKYDNETRRVASPYPEMNMEELKNMKIPAYKDSALWLWTTHKFIWNAKELLEHWGFEYKAILTWNKEKLGMGEWLRMQCEFCLLGIKGNPSWELTNERDILTVSRREHSRKPDELYKLIEKINPSKRNLDIFSREEREGWDQYGNETSKF